MDYSELTPGMFVGINFDGWCDGYCDEEFATWALEVLDPGYETTLCRTYFGETVEIENRYLEFFDDMCSQMGDFRMPFRAHP